MPLNAAGRATKINSERTRLSLTISSIFGRKILSTVLRENENSLPIKGEEEETANIDYMSFGG